MELKAFMPGMILDELADAVGGYDHVSIEMSDRATYGVDYFWVGRMWQDRGQVPPMPDWIVRPGSAEEVSKILKIANYYKIPVHIWGRRLRLPGRRAADVRRHPHGHEAHEPSH